LFLEMNWAIKALKVVEKIPAGKFLSYKAVAKKAGNEKAARAVANLMAKNTNPRIPCHRVIKNNNEVGGYKGSLNQAWQKAALLLKEGAIGVIPTDTIYGLCGSALKKEVVEKIYQLRKRDPRKPMIVLISSFDDLHRLGIKLESWQKKFLNKFWPGKVSVVLKCPSKKFEYLHRGTKTLALRLPKDKKLIRLLKISGPLVAPSANWEGKKPAVNLREAKKYFRDQVFYYGQGERRKKPSRLIDLTKKEIKILRN